MMDLKTIQDQFEAARQRPALGNVWQEIVDHLNEVTFVSTDQWLPGQIERMHAEHQRLLSAHYTKLLDGMEFNRIRIG